MLKKICPQKNSTETIFYLWDIKSGTFQTDSTFTDLFGINPSKFSDISHLIFKDDLTSLESNVRKSICGKNIVMPLRIKTFDRGYDWFTVCFGRIGGDIIAGILTSSDFDKFQHRKESMALMYERMQFALQAAQAGFWDWDVATGKVYYDPQYVKMMGYQLNEFAQTISSWVDRLHPDDHAETVKFQFSYIEDPSLGDSFASKYRFLAADGNYRWIRSHGQILSRDANGKALRLVGLHVDITDEEEAKVQLEFIAVHDMLTGLHNRSYFEHNFVKLDQDALPVAYILVDADGLKMVNDCINHSTGDKVLQKLANVLRFSIRDSDLLARIGGDEFVILLARTEEGNAERVLQKIARNIENANQVGGAMIVCASLGLACATTMEKLATLSVRADASMAEQKKKQRPDSLSRTKVWIESLGWSHKGYKDKRTMKEHK